MTDTQELLDKAHALADIDAGDGYLQFLEHVIVDAQPLKRPFRLIAEDWQWKRSIRSAGAINHLAGYDDSYTGVKSFWNGYHKGSDKTHDSARELCWLLGWSKRRLNLYICGGSEDQAALITTAMKGILLDNPWIGKRVECTKLTAAGESGSEMTVLPMNAYTGQGIFPDYVVATEVTHWMHDEGRVFWEFILESVNKRPNCVLKVETNAGTKQTWQWAERNRIEKSKYWSFYEAPVGKPLPTWMNQDKIDDDSQGLTPGERDRLYKNRWIDPGEDKGYLTLADAEACVDYSLKEEDRGQRGFEYYAVMDYGGVYDRAAMVVMHPIPGTDTCVIDRLDCWQGTHENRIAINHDPEADESYRSLEEWFDITRQRFHIRCLIVDPYQLEGLAIKYERRGLRVERFEYHAGKKNYRMAQLLQSCVQNRKIRWSPWAGLLPKTVEMQGRSVAVEDYTLALELSMLVKKPMSYGYKFDHEAGRHDDRAAVIGMGLIHIFPEAAPLGGHGPRVIEGNNKPVLPGTVPTHRSVNPQYDPIAAYRLFGNTGVGSSWENGDMGDRP